MRHRSCASPGHGLVHHVCMLRACARVCCLCARVCKYVRARCVVGWSVAWRGVACGVAVKCGVVYYAMSPTQSGGCAPVRVVELRGAGGVQRAGLLQPLPQPHDGDLPRRRHPRLAGPFAPAHVIHHTFHPPTVSFFVRSFVSFFVPPTHPPMHPCTHTFTPTHSFLRGHARAHTQPCKQQHRHPARNYTLHRCVLTFFHRTSTPTSSKSTHPQSPAGRSVGRRPAAAVQARVRDRAAGAAGGERGWPALPPPPAILPA